uniref:Transmembrane protein 54 n=1 Tax=Crocodylus porosus TaxID=8502 RepID=A0A7M4E272_CROPO
MCRLDNLDPGGHQKLLMKMGLILIVIGHLNFIVSALVHGTVLRYVANPQDTISLQYAISNIVAVSSTLLKWALFSLSASSTLLSLFCSLGLAVSMILTFANRGRALLATCTFVDMDLIQISSECPFDPTRIYSSTLSLWTISLILDSVEIIFSIRCFLLTLRLLHLRLCCGTRKKKVTLWHRGVPPTPRTMERPQHCQCRAPSTVTCSGPGSTALGLAESPEPLQKATLSRSALRSRGGAQLAPAHEASWCGLRLSRSRVGWLGPNAAGSSHAPSHLGAASTTSQPGAALPHPAVALAPCSKELPAPLSHESCPSLFPGLAAGCPGGAPGSRRVLGPAATGPSGGGVALSGATSPQHLGLRAMPTHSWPRCPQPKGRPAAGGCGLDPELR